MLVLSSWSMNRDNGRIFTPKVKTLCHKAARLLNHLKERGASVILSTPPWTDRQRTETMRRNPHKSAVKYVDFLHDELLDFVKKGFWMVLPCRLLKKHKRLIQNLCISPMGVVPQRAPPSNHRGLFVLWAQ
jgi:hypothetical protein